MIETIVIWISLIEISSTFGTGMPMFLRLLMYLRIRKWVRENLPDTWKWKVNFVLLEYRSFNITGKIRDKNNLRDMFQFGIYSPTQNFEPVKMSDTIWVKVKHRFGKPESPDDIISKVKNSDSSFDPKKFRRDKHLDLLLK